MTKLSKYLIALGFFVAVLSFSLTPSAYAKEVQLLDQPQVNAHVVGMVDLNSGVIPIFTSKAGDWIKVADPRNGNVGWIKSSDFSTDNGSTSFTFTQKIANDGKGSHSYQLLQSGPPPAEAQAMLENAQKQQQVAQQSVQKMMQEMANDINRIYQQNRQLMQSSGMTTPIIMPVVIVPQQQAPGATNEGVNNNAGAKMH